MAMRYHWGHGVGHTYSHQSPRMQVSVIGNIQRDIEVENILLPQSTSSGRRGPSSGGPSSFPNDSNSNVGDDDEDNQDNDGSDDEDDEDDDDDDYDYEDDYNESEEDEISDTEDDQMHEMYD